MDRGIASIGCGVAPAMGAGDRARHTAGPPAHPCLCTTPKRSNSGSREHGKVAQRGALRSFITALPQAPQSLLQLWLWIIFLVPVGLLIQFPQDNLVLLHHLGYPAK